MYENAVSHSNFNGAEKEQLTWKIYGFNRLVTLFERLDKSGRVRIDWHKNFKKFEL